MGKWYNHRTFLAYKDDLKYDKNTPLEEVLPHVIHIANTFSRDAIAIGTLDYNDLIQAGNLGLVEAWNKVDWDRIEASPNPQGELWSFLKIRIKGAIRREIDKHGEHVARPINMMEQARKKMDFRGVDKVLVNIFPNFFDDAMVTFQNDDSLWISVLLEEAIVDELNKTVRNKDHIDILLRFYGIGFDEMSQKELASMYNLSPGNIQKIVQRTKNKLDTEEFEKIIENIYEKQS